MHTLSMQRALSKQRGTSFFSWVGILFIIGLLAQTVIRLSPVYLEGYYLKEILISLSHEPELSSMSVSQVRERLNKSFSVNGIESEPAESLKISRIDDKMIVNMNYEKRIAFLGNIDFILSFNYHLDSSKPNECCRP